MENTRINTLFFNFRDTHFHPSEIEIHRWLRSLDVKDGDLCVIDYHFHSKHVVVKFNEEEKMHEFFENFGPSLIFDKDEVPYEIPVMIAGSKHRNVKIKFIPTEIEIEEIKNTLTKYGAVESIKWEEPVKFNEDIYEVKRERLNVAMSINKHIPSFITIKGIRLNVTYQGQPRTCSKCDDPNHEARDCNAKPTYSSSVRKHMRNGDRKLSYEEEDVLNLAKAITDISNLESTENISQLKRFKASNPHEWLKTKKKRRLQHHYWNQSRSRALPSTPRNNLHAFKQKTLTICKTSKTQNSKQKNYIKGL